MSPVRWGRRDGLSLKRQTEMEEWRNEEVATAAILPLSTATDVSVVGNPFDITTLAIIGRSSVAALAALLSLTDPERRQQMQTEEVGGGDKEVVKEYFNNDGFQQWCWIYGETDDVNTVQLDIRIGHSKTMEN
ncbi:Magnesium protoporphyrin IX methyltransferase [Abeliophyllum distichum]|uniref:Magnesium protoporphyrin IX methyltransferase n=1 Tax=Abeliophyllum distichum TaxID=126358 RepID=A0ABD1UKJ0_9LAMI